VRVSAFVVAAFGLLPGVALAGPSESELESQGEQFAKQGRFSEAIESFKAADRIVHRANHVCLIALAYTRRELWPQAEIFIALCHSRATADDPLPEWVPKADQLIADRLASVNVAPVAITTDPAVPGVELTVSSFSPDEVFEPRTIHLPPGHHTVIARAPGFLDSRKEILVTGRAAQPIVLELYRPGEEPKPPSPSKVPWLLVGAGGAVMFGAVVLEGTWYKSARDDLAGAMTPSRYHQLESAYDTRRKVVIGMYAIGGAMVITGLVLRYTKYKDRPEQAPVVSITPGAGGGIMSVEWQR
jgi:hypothetical protein